MELLDSSFRLAQPELVPNIRGMSQQMGIVFLFPSLKKCSNLKTYLKSKDISINKTKVMVNDACQAWDEPEGV